MLKPSEVSRSRVCVALRVMTSTSPDCSATKRCCAVVGVNLDFSASPNIATAMARQRSTSSPVHLPWLSAIEKPARPVFTAHCTKPLAFTASKVWPADAGCDAKTATPESAASAAKDLRNIAEPPVFVLSRTSIAKGAPGSARPEDGHAIERELAILGCQHEPLQLCLSNQHTVKRIAVVTRQTTRQLRMSCRDVEQTKPSFAAGRCRTSSKVEFADFAFDANFPNGDGAHRHVTLQVLYRVPQGCRQPTITPLPPKKDVGVEQKAHESAIDAERLAQFRRKRIVEIGGYPFDLHRPRGFAAALLNDRQGHELGHRLAVFGDDDLLAGRSTVHQRRKLILGFVEVEDLGHDNLANLAKLYILVPGPVKSSVRPSSS